MPIIKANGIEIYYEEMGSGPPLIFIAGLAADHTTWEAHRFSDQFRVITFDNRASGQTTVPEKSFSIETMADDTIALCRALGIEKAHFVGHSMGGHIAQWIGAKYSESVHKLVIACSEQEFSPISRIATDLQLDLRRYGVPLELLLKNYLPVLFSEKFLEDDDQVSQFSKEILEAPHRQTDAAYRLQVEALREHNTKSLLSKISAPTLIIGCEQDLLTPLKNSVYLAEHIRNAELCTIENSGHLPFVEKTDLFYKIIGMFL